MEDVLPGGVRAKNTIVPTSVDPDLFREIDRTEARRRLGWDRVDRIALFASDPTVPSKRYWLAETAVRLAREALPSVKLRVLRNVAPDEVPVAMGAADCLLFTSASEGSPNVVKEALMCNLPVVSTRVGDVAEVLESVKPSYFCDDQPETIAAALVECLTSPVRSNGRAASGWLAADSVAERVILKYEEVSGRRLRRTQAA
jgi:glycosyltransferase involved in cell wall biosynthesis